MPTVTSPSKTPYIIGGAAIVAVAALVIVWFSFLSTEARMMRAIDRGELFAPQGSSAFDLFSQLKSQGLSAGTRSNLKLKLLPKLTAAADVLLQKRREGDDLDKADIPRLVQIYAWAAEVAPDDPRILARYSYAQGYAALIGKDLSNAMQFLQRSVEQDNSWAFSFNELGRTYSRLDDRPHAEEYYKRAADLDPSWAVPHVNLGVVCIHLKDYALAEQALMAATQTDSTPATPWYFLGEVYEQQNRFAEAINAYERALQLAANKPSASFRVNLLERRIEKLRSLPASLLNPVPNAG